ncbi:hypothetical protein P4571_08245 [Niallia alba]|uniref:hypothetical protein n=1 Tax=Niallia alba TaxID=2729105 RepID=UPI002E2181D4|nr:hypothetical protein [Niallia alba]
MPDIIELMNKLADKNPELKRMIEEDNKYIESRKQYHLTQGYGGSESVRRAWDDYWKMAKERDGVEFEIGKL